MTGFYFGHFRHQGVKISKCHKPIFYSKLTKEHDGSTQNAWIFLVPKLTCDTLIVWFDRPQFLVIPKDNLQNILT